MKCPKCGKELRRSKKDPNYGLCDNCRKKYRWVDEFDEDDYEEDYEEIERKSRVKNTAKAKKIKGNTKFCKYCKEEIDAGAKICPYCKKKQGGILKWVAVTVIALGIIGALFGGDDSSEKSNPANSDNIQISSDQEQSGTDTQSNEPSQEEVSNEENIIHVGETFENNGLRVTINSYNSEFTGYNEFLPPSDGKKYIEVSFTYENVGNGGDRYVSIYDCDCYADNTACEQAYIGEEDFVNGNISPGRNVSFKAYYQVPISAGTIELEYDTSFWTYEKVVILLQ